MHMLGCVIMYKKQASALTESNYTKAVFSLVGVRIARYPTLDGLLETATYIPRLHYADVCEMPTPFCIHFLEGNLNWLEIANRVCQGQGWVGIDVTVSQACG